MLLQDTESAPPAESDSKRLPRTKNLEQDEALVLKKHFQEEKVKMEEELALVKKDLEEKKKEVFELKNELETEKGKVASLKEELRDERNELVQANIDVNYLRGLVDDLRKEVLIYMRIRGPFFCFHNFNFSPVRGKRKTEQ